MKRVLLAGLPNVGKSTIFRRLTDRKTNAVSLYRGTAVKIEKGVLKFDGGEAELIDLPGICNLASSFENEAVVREMLIKEAPDVIIQVADTKNLKRSLVLASCLAEFGIPMMFVLNMADEAARRGIKVKRHRLAEMLGTEVVETSASEGIGKDLLRASLARARVPSLSLRLPPLIADVISALEGLMEGSICSKRALACLCLTDEAEISRWAQELGRIGDKEKAVRLIEETRMSFYQRPDLIIARARDSKAEALYAESTYFTPAHSTHAAEKLGDMARHPFAGGLILFSLLVSLYYVVGKFAAGYLVDFLVNDFFEGIVAPYFKAVTAMIPFPFIREAIMGEYGLYPMGLVPAVGIVMPIIVVFFFTFGFIEDSGYFSRLSILLDRIFRKIGLNGKAVLPIVLGFSCVTMATISTRVLDSKRERFIAIFLLSLGIPCSAKLSVILVILAQVSFSAFLVVFGVVFFLTVLSGYIISRLTGQRASSFIMDIPPIRIPSIITIVQKTSHRSTMFLREALPLFFAGAFGLFLADRLGLLALLEQAAAPVVTGFLGLPPEFAESLIMGFIRGEAGIAVLKKLVDAGTMSNLQLVVAMIVTILFIPCVTNFLLIIKEQGSKKAFAIIVSVTIFSILTGGIMNHLLRWTNATF